MWTDRRLCDLFQVAHPIIQAPMAGASTVEMAVAAANSGIVGSLGCAMMSVDTYTKTFDQARALTNGLLNMNFFCHVEPSLDKTKSDFASETLMPFYQELVLGEMP